MGFAFQTYMQLLSSGLRYPHAACELKIMDCRPLPPSQPRTITSSRGWKVESPSIAPRWYWPSRVAKYIQRSSPTFHLIRINQNHTSGFWNHSHDHNHDTYIEYGWIWISTLVKTCPTIRMSETGLVSGWLWTHPLGRSLWSRPSSLGSLSSDQKLPKSWDFQLDFGDSPPHL